MVFSNKLKRGPRRGNPCLFIYQATLTSLAAVKVVPLSSEIRRQ